MAMEQSQQFDTIIDNNITNQYEQSVTHITTCPNQMELENGM